MRPVHSQPRARKPDMTRLALRGNSNNPAGAPRGTAPSIGPANRLVIDREDFEKGFRRIRNHRLKTLHVIDHAPSHMASGMGPRRRHVLFHIADLGCRRDGTGDGQAQHELQKELRPITRTELARPFGQRMMSGRFEIDHQLEGLSQSPPGRDPLPAAAGDLPPRDRGCCR